MHVRKIPLRTCVGCGTTHDKRELLRVVRLPDGQVLVDPSGKRSGRGAYICPDPSCLDKALKNQRLEHALTMPISDMVLEQLRGAVKPIHG